MVEQYSEDVNHLENLKEFDKRLRESTNKSQNVKDYEGIIEFSKMSIEAKQLGAELIPQYFQFYTSHSKQAFDAYKDIIEAVNLRVRVQAIRNLPLFCKDAPEFVSKIIDVLVQCLDIDQQEQLDAVHETFVSLFQQDTLPHLIKKRLGHVSGEEETKMVMDFLTSLSKFGVKAPQERMQELVEIVQGQADLDAKLNISVADRVDRLIPYLQAALPFIVRGDPDSKFLNFLKKHIMPDFDKLPEPRRLDLLKALAEISPHTTALVALQMLPLIVQLLKNNMPAKKTVEKPDSRYVECLLYVFHHMAHKVPNETNSLCGYKFVTKQPPSDRIGENFSKLYKEFAERLTNLEVLIKASMDQLVQEMSDHDKANLQSESFSAEEEASLYTRRENTKTKLRTCINILAMTEILHAETPSFIGDNSFVKLSWKEPLKPLITGRAFHINSPEAPPNMEAVHELIEGHNFPDDLLDKLVEENFCELEDEEHVKWLLGLSGFQQAKDTSPESKFTLHESPEVAILFWKIGQSKLLKFLTPKSWNGILGYVRDQLSHIICWAYVSSDLVSAARILRGWELEYIPLCPWYLCAFYSPEYLGRANNSEEGHVCYGYNLEDALLHIKGNGIPKEICKEFDCEDFKPPNADEPQKRNRKIRTIQTIDSMEDALLLLPNQPVGADLIVFDRLYEEKEIYYGPGPKSSGFSAYHGVIITSIELYNHEVVAICKMSNGTEVANNGYVRVSLATMYMVVGVCPEQREYVRATFKLTPLLSNFVIIDIDEKEKEREKETEKQDENPEQNPEENHEQNPEEKPEENQEPNPEEKPEQKQYPDFVAPGSKFHNFLNKHIMPDFDKVRVQAIGKLPLFCKDTPEFVSKIIDVLVQCLNTEQQEQLDAVHEAFMSLFQQDAQASLTALFKHTEATLTTDDQIRVKVLHYFRDKVFPLKGELLKPQEEMERHITDLIKKSLGHVSGEEIKMFMAFLTSLSIFRVKSPQERMQELVEIVEGQADLDAKLNRGDPDSKFLNFLKKHIMPDFDKLPEPMKLDLLKALAEISPHTTALVAPQMLPSIVQLLKVLHEEAPSFIRDTSVVTKPLASTRTLGKRPANGTGNGVGAKKARTESSGC